MAKAVLDAPDERRRHVVSLRPLRPEDEDDLQAWERDEEVRRHYFGTRSPIASATPLIEREPCSDRILRAIVDVGGDLLGWIELRQISWRRRAAELRVCLGRRDRWGMGLGTEAVRAILAEATRRRLLHVYLRVAVWNRRAIRAYQKCGFHAEAILHAGRRRAEGMEDVLLMSVDLGEPTP